MKKLFLLLAMTVGAAISIATAPPPEIVGTHWSNTTDNHAITLESRKNKVTVVHFWTFACSNCHANLPIYNRIYDKFKSQGVEMIGIHTPELQEERDAARLGAAIKRFNIKYPVVTDNENTNWNAWHLEYWPTVYVIDRKGEIVFKWAGELNWQGADGDRQLDAAISRALRG